MLTVTTSTSKTMKTDPPRLRVTWSLTDHARRGREDLDLTCYRGRRGRPTLFDARAHRAEILALTPGTPVRSLLDVHADRVADVEVDNPYILRDMDTPGDYERLRVELATGTSGR